MGASIADWEFSHNVTFDDEFDGVSVGYNTDIYPGDPAFGGGPLPNKDLYGYLAANGGILSQAGVDKLNLIRPATPFGGLSSGMWEVKLLYNQYGNLDLRCFLQDATTGVGFFYARIYMRAGGTVVVWIGGCRQQLGLRGVSPFFNGALWHTRITNPITAISGLVPYQPFWVRFFWETGFDVVDPESRPSMKMWIEHKVIDADPFSRVAIACNNYATMLPAGSSPFINPFNVGFHGFTPKQVSDITKWSIGPTSYTLEPPKSQEIAIGGFDSFGLEPTTGVVYLAEIALFTPTGGEVVYDQFSDPWEL